jgi:hypothetical protein
MVRSDRIESLREGHLASLSKGGTMLWKSKSTVTRVSSA